MRRRSICYEYGNILSLYCFSWLASVAYTEQNVTNQFENVVMWRTVHAMQYAVKLGLRVTDEHTFHTVLAQSTATYPLSIALLPNYVQFVQ